MRCRTSLQYRDDLRRRRTTGPRANSQNMVSSTVERAVDCTRTEFRSSPRQSSCRVQHQRRIRVS
jgi:hypothetical protein